LETSLKNTMSHPLGVTVEIVGTAASDKGRSCEQPAVCGSVLVPDAVVRIRRIQTTIDGVEQPCLACYWVSDGVDQCLVGFLPRHLLKSWKNFDGKLAQVTDVYSDSESKEKRKRHHRNFGCCLASLIDTVPLEELNDTTTRKSTKKQKGEEEKNG